MAAKVDIPLIRLNSTMIYEWGLPDIFQE